MAIFFNGGRSSVVTTTPDVYLPADGGRKGLVIQASGAGTLLVGFGKAPVSGQCLTIAAGAMIDFQNPPCDAIYLAAAASTVTALILAG